MKTINIQFNNFLTSNIFIVLRINLLALFKFPLQKIINYFLTTWRLITNHIFKKNPHLFCTLLKLETTRSLLLESIHKLINSMRMNFCKWHKDATGSLPLKA